MLHLSAAVDQPSVYDAASYVDLARLAEHGVLDFVTLDDTFARPGPDALSVLSRAAPATSRVGLVPTVTTTHTEPFHVQPPSPPSTGSAGAGRAGGSMSPRPRARPGSSVAARRPRRGAVAGGR